MQIGVLMRLCEGACALLSPHLQPNGENGHKMQHTHGHNFLCLNQW